MHTAQIKLTSINVSKLQLPVFSGCTKPPLDSNNDGLYEDINGNGRLDFDDVVVYFNNMIWVTQNGLVTYFDYNNNRRIDFSDVVRLYNIQK
jgi:PKD repeat protein